LPLTALKVKHAKPGRHCDMHGLYLVVRDSGSRSWMLRIQRKGWRRDFGLGPAHDVSLAEARCLASEIRKMVRAGLDPVKERGLKRPRAADFETVARRCYEAMKDGWKNGEHASWLPSLENHVFPLIGRKPVDEVDSAAVLSVLGPIWVTIGPTARRLLQRIGTVLDYAHIKGLIPNEVSLKSVMRGLPRQSHKVTHRKAMPYADVPEFVARLCRSPNTVGRDALKLTILTAVRSNETRGATWSEFDLDAGVWTIPPQRMKMKVGHIVPLPPAAVALLKRIHVERSAIDGDVKPERFVFTCNGKTPVSDMTLLKVLRDMNLGDVTVHGFRSTFTDWAAERTNFPKEVVDKALAHQIPNAVEAAYRRTDFFDKRRVLMKEWAAYAAGGMSVDLDTGKAATDRILSRNSVSPTGA